MHLMLCLLTLSTLVFVALTQHLIQSTMRCENCINSVNIDNIECIRDHGLVSTVSTYIVLMVWLKSPEPQLSKTFCGLKSIEYSESYGQECVDVFCIDSVDIDSTECIRDPCLVSRVSTYIVLMA